MPIDFMQQRYPRHLAAALFSTLLTGVTPFVPAQTNSEAPWSLDHRYAPPQWQTAICLPDDWRKTLVAKDGGLLYDYPGKFTGFATKITFGTVGGNQWERQELVSPRVAITRTTKQAGQIEIVEEAFAVAPSSMPQQKQVSDGFVVERVGESTGQTGWAKPPKNTDPAFANVAIGYGRPIDFRFKARSGETFTVVFGLCEGWHTNAAQRVLNLLVNGRAVKTVDLIAEKGRNVPALYAFPARDENGDGWVDLSVAAVQPGWDKNAILNVLLVFHEGDAPPLEQLLRGQTAKPALAHVDCSANTPSSNPPRNDVLLVHLRNTQDQAARIVPTLLIESTRGIAPTANHTIVTLDAGTMLICAQPWEKAEPASDRLLLTLPELTLPPKGERSLAFTVARRGSGFVSYPETLAQAVSARAKTQAYWQGLNLPYDHLVVPDPQVQAVIDAAIRNIYQAREIKQGLPAFQVGPTCYRGLWVVDGSFLLEAITYLGRAAETRAGIQYLLSFQRDDGSFMMIDGHWKETGIVLWAVTRHARLTGDPAWLRTVWPKVERGFAYIGKMRQMPKPDAPNANLIPDGFSDGGLADQVPEYTNIYWTLAGMRAAVEAARWLGHDAQAQAWQNEYDDFYATFRRAAARDMKSDAQGNRYLPIRMVKGEGIPPQKAQWAFCHAVFPGKVFASDDPLQLGNMAMLRAVESQGLVFDTGWLKNGIWTYFGGFYGNAWLWLGDGDKAARTLYAFGNHSSPLLCWREEQMPVGHGDTVVGDMPHNWASAEFIRLTRHCLALERGRELHLFEGFPAKWAKPGAVTKLRDIATEFGPLSLEFRISKDGTTGELWLSPPQRTPPDKIILHLDHWSGATGTVELPVKGKTTRQIKISQ
jgi:hypothetical protein